MQQLTAEAVGFAVGALTAVFMLSLSAGFLWRLVRVVRAAPAPGEDLSVLELRVRALGGQVFLWCALGSGVLALATGWPFPALADIETLGFRAILGLAVAFNLGFELWFWRPWAPKVQVQASREPCVPDSSAARLELELLGFALLGRKTERSRRAKPCDVYAHEAERAWANVTADQARGVFGYFLSTFADGASVITWTFERKQEQLRSVTVGGTPGFPEAWELHRTTVSRLSDTHGALLECRTPEDREQATLRYYAAGGF